MDNGIGTSIQKGRKLLRRAEEAVIKFTSRGCRLGPLELVDEIEALTAPETPAVEVDEDTENQSLRSLAMEIPIQPWQLKE